MLNNDYEKLSPNECADIARQTALDCYGVVGMASPNGITFISQLLPSFLNKSGVEVVRSKKGFKINVYIIAEQGTAFGAIAKNLCDVLKYRLDKEYKVKTDGINIHIKGVHTTGKRWKLLTI